MRRHLLFPLLLILPAAHAQIFELYGTFSPTHVNNVQTGVNSSNQIQYTAYWSSGFGGGVTFGVLPIGPIRIGLDLRGSSKPGLNGADIAMGGIKLGVHVPLIRIKPYVQGSVGYLGTRTSNVSPSAAGSTFGNQYIAYEIIGGIDYPLVHFVDFRVIEIGGGQALNTGISSGSNASLLTINSGIVLHF